MENIFTELFEYNLYCNQKLADAFVLNEENLSEKNCQLYSHILNAHHIWLSRIESVNNSFGVWDIHPFADFKSIDKTNYEKTLIILKNYDLSLTVDYSNTKGQRFSNIVKDVLIHVVNHSTYHRGQIAMEMRMGGLQPLATDYIIYKRL